MKKILLRVLASITILLVLLMAISALSNIGLPTESTRIDQLSETEKARVAEAFHLRKQLGNTVWQGWGDVLIPLILHNEAYAFLLEYPGAPPNGWVKVPSDHQEGGEWELVADDTFLGRPYYRQSLPGQSATPENFTVLVGEHWVATIFTREYAEIAFYKGFREELPAFLRPIIPYRLLWKLVMNSTESYIEGIAHESFHAFQGINAPDRLITADKIASIENDYPWDANDAENNWNRELDLLYQAVTATADEQVVEQTRQFLEQREARRKLQGTSSEVIDYERKREWLEGLAKYAELSLGLAAAHTPNYQPVSGILDDPDFRRYTTQESFWKQQMKEIRRQSNQKGETRFYYSGMAQAILLDQLMPGWKLDHWDQDIWLEDLLARAVYSAE